MHLLPSRTASLALTAALAAAAWPALPAAASHDVTPARVEGADRLETAAAVAALLYPNGTSEALLAKAEDFPDALTGAPLASQRGAPILLTDGTGLPAATASALQSLGVSRVTLLGGADAIDDSVAQALRDRGYTVDRVSGATRYQTAAQIARTVQEANQNTANFPGGRRAVFLANGLRFADALAASAPAAAAPAQIPILLVGQDSVPGPTELALRDLDIDLAILVGGPAAVSERVRQQIEDMGINTDRVSGADRTATATSVASFAQEYLDFDGDSFLLARGDAFPDALAAGPLGAARRDPILLARDPSTLSAQTSDYLAQQCGSVRVVRAVGGQEAVTGGTLGHAEAAAQECHGGRPQSRQTFLVAPQEPIAAQPGDDTRLSVGIRYDDRDFTGPVDVALFPCRNADVVGSGPDTFADVDDDGRADGLGESDTSTAWVVRVNGEATQGPTVLRGAGPDEDGDLDVVLRAGAADCTVAVVWEDVDDDGELDLDADNTPGEPYGVGQASWS